MWDSVKCTAEVDVAYIHLDIFVVVCHNVIHSYDELSFIEVTLTKAMSKRSQCVVLVCETQNMSSSDVRSIEAGEAVPPLSFFKEREN